MPLCQHNLAVVRARDALVRSRTLLINHVRGAVKACGAALPSCTAEAFQRKTADHIPGGLRPALPPLVEPVGELTARIAAAGREVEALCEAYPETDRNTAGSHAGQVHGDAGPDDPASHHDNVRRCVGHRVLPCRR